MRETLLEMLNRKIKYYEAREKRLAAIKPVWRIDEPDFIRLELTREILGELCELRKNILLRHDRVYP